jgi:hypothetical protein
MSNAALIETACDCVSPSSKRHWLLASAARLLYSPAVNFVFLFLNILLLNAERIPVPEITEYFYLPRLVKQYHASYLLNDWTMSGEWPEHFLFDSVFGVFTLPFSLETVGWLGRIVCWSLLIVGLFRLGRHFQIPRWMITLSVWLWVIYHQSVVANCWMFGTFEAKIVAYILLLFALDGFIERKTIVPSVLLGLCFSFHPAVGAWSGLAVGLSLIGQRTPIRRLLRSGLTSMLFALPGLIPLLPLIAGSSADRPEQWKFLALVHSPHHLDPFSWKAKELALVYFLFAFNWIQSRNQKENQAVRFLLAFQGFLCLFFTLGLVWRWNENYSLLRFFPFRLFPLFVPLFFWFHLMNALRNSSTRRVKVGLAAMGIAALFILGNPVMKYAHRLKQNYVKLKKPEDDAQKSFRWVAKNTPNGSIVISPPWREESLYLSQRAQIANLHCIQYDRMKGWLERMESMVGSEWESSSIRNQVAAMKRYYDSLDENQIANIAARYRADYLISETAYVFPILFDTGSYKVYSLPQAKH